MTPDRPSEEEHDYDVVVVGAGFAGMFMLYRLRELGLRTRVYEAAGDVGGTWYWNRYPGARCDVESMFYSYSFSPELEQEWHWTERYSTQPEILRYLSHVADRFDLRRDIQFETRVTAAHYDEAQRRWDVTTDRGDEITARIFISAMGCLSDSHVPDIAGIDDFEGDWYHTARWPTEGVDLRGKRVGVIGTGSTGIQVTTTIAPEVGHLFVFQRTPNYSFPARNAPLDPEVERTRKENYPALRQTLRLATNVNPSGRVSTEDSPDERARRYEEAWQVGGPGILRTYDDLITDIDANTTLAEFVRTKIRATVKDPKVAELLSPTDHPVATKRPCIDTGYFEIFNRDNVTLVDIRSAPIVRITPKGIETEAGDYDLDVIIFATGFDAYTGSLFKIDIRGRGGESLRTKWAEGPRNYLGLETAGFPNFFTITGALSPSVRSNVAVSIEQHVEWIADCLAYMEKHGYREIEATKDAEDRWVEYVAELVDKTLLPLGGSWWMGANIPGKPRVYLAYPSGTGPYRTICDEVAENDYEGFALSE